MRGMDDFVAYVFEVLCMFEPVPLAPFCIFLALTAGGVLVTHRFGMMDSLTTTLGRPCPSWIVISCVFIVVGPILFLVYAVWTIRRHMQKG